MAGLVPAIHVFISQRKAWMPATSAGMTAAGVRSPKIANSDRYSPSSF